MTTIVFNVQLFRVEFPLFADAAKYPDAILQSYFDTATCYVSDQDYGCLAGDCRLRALNLMTAHLIRLGDMINMGTTPSFVTSSTVGSVTVAVKPPPETDQWAWWMNLTPYGQQLLALLSAASVGGFYVGGLPERAAFRKVFGVF